MRRSKKRVLNICHIIIGEVMGTLVPPLLHIRQLLESLFHDVVDGLESNQFNIKP